MYPHPIKLEPLVTHYIQEMYPHPIKLEPLVTHYIQEMYPQPIKLEPLVTHYIQEMYAHPIKLQTLILYGNPIGSGGAVAFASMLKKNQCLKKLYFNDDSVGVEGALELIESLKHNTTLEELWLSEKCKPPSFSTIDKTLQDRVIFDREEFSDARCLSISKQVMEEHGTMDQTIMHCIFVGPAGVGKSSLLKRLLHQKLNPER